MVKGRAVPSVEVIHCLVWCVSVFKHAHIDAFVIVLLCVCVFVCVCADQCGGGLAVSPAPAQFAINLSAACPEIPCRSCVVPSAA